ncbi:MAG: DUF6364 family protein [Ginsengibacter sp.]
MDHKITLSFDESVIARAKKYAANNNISLSRLIEFLLKKVTAANYENLEDYPISEWVSMVAEGPAEYETRAKRTRKKAKDEFFKSKK